MSTKIHIAMFCSDAAYAARKSFYTRAFRKKSWEGSINDGAEHHRYSGSIWDRENSDLFEFLKSPALTALKDKLADNRANGYLFALLINPNLTSMQEELAHIGFIFDSREEFDAEIEKRGINPQKIETHQTGNKQVFEKDKDGVEWEFLYKTKIP